MRRLSNPKLGDFIYSNRQGQMHKTVSKDKGIRPLLSTLKEGGSIAIVADQHASTSEGVETVFFGHPARSHATPALLHLKTKTPIIVGGLRRVDDNLKFEFVVHKVIKYEATGDKEKDIKAITQEYTTALEMLIRETPEQWLWAHRRWLDINRKKLNKEG
jgi:KDO2-lipid IV(A) lauroyltransferase